MDQEASTLILSACGDLPYFVVMCVNLLYETYFGDRDTGIQLPYLK